MEEICISTLPSDFVEEPIPENRESNALLEQRNRLRMQQISFELFNEQFLSVSVQAAMHKIRNYDLHVGILDPQPRRALHIAWEYLVVFLLLALFVGQMAFSGENILDGIFIIPAIAAGISLFQGIYQSHDRLIFYSKHGRVPLVILFNRNPNKTAFNTFTAALTEHIQQAGRQFNDQSEALSKELREHRRLREMGIISGKRYNIVKQRILELHD